MVYILNKYISPRKTMGNALTTIYGIGPKRALAISNASCINPNNRFFSLAPPQVSEISKRISNVGNLNVTFKMSSKKSP